MTEKDPSKPESAPSGASVPSLKTAIKTVVKSTNTVLASLEEVTYETSSNFSSRLLAVARQGRYVAAKAYTAYGGRREFGPQIVAGTALLTGGIMGLRRGKFTGAFSSLLGGGAAYGAVYGVDEKMLPKF
uniref:Uncharacterized protein n=1 Tax=Ditylum brightwellii TaxID=49249 RepID=A0A6S8XZG1_9STRA|mmetsp:Transcript_18057/g.23959  ORF Transcript_18057/g.23959 Transcript_18057/m.23959 type:complete len:130 (-) Transcript_18057:173-562(-)